MTTETKYKGYKLITTKNKTGGYYNTNVFKKDAIRSTFEVSYKFKKDSLAIAKIKIDNIDE